MYREMAPSPRLADSVECFWTMPRSNGHRVMPDGCADILFSHEGKVNVVGAMTRYLDVENTGPFFGVRFRPGCWAGQFGMPADRLTDEIKPLDSFWGWRGKDLADRLGSAESDSERVRILETILTPPGETRPIQRAIRWMEERRGCVSLDHVADQCGLSVRQFRRVCLAETGLSPKFLARVLRFRYALSRLPHGAGADLALDCGYYDQAHLINEFREFAGRTPASMLTEFSIIEATRVA